MDRLVKRNLKRSARLSALYITVIGIAFVIIFPMFFLVSFSFMSDYETFSEWPKPLFPSFRVDFVIDRDAEGYHLLIYNKADGAFVNFGPTSFNRDEDDLASLMSFIRKYSNCSITTDEIRNHLREVDNSGQAEFQLRKRILDNYVLFFKVTRDAPAAFFRSILVACATIAISLTIGGMAGYAFARYIFKGKNLLKLSVLFVRMFPAVSIAVPMVIILARMGLSDQPVGLALVYSVGQISLNIWVTASVFMSIPVSFEEGALIFGTNRIGAFWHITLPLALPGLAACAMYSFIGSWNETISAIVLTQFNPTFPVVVYKSLVGAQGQLNLVTAGSIVQALPAIIFTLIIRKYILQMWGGVRV